MKETFVNGKSILLLMLLLIAVLGGCGNDAKNNRVGANVDSTVAKAPREKELAGASKDVQMHPEYAKSLARFAYIWSYALVNTYNRSIALSKAKQPGTLGGILPMAPTGRLSMLTDYIDPGQNAIAEAPRYNVLPLDWRGTVRFNAEAMGRPTIMGHRKTMTYYPGTIGLLDAASPNMTNKSWTVTADFEVSGKQSGMIVTHGGLEGN